MIMLAFRFKNLKETSVQISTGETELFLGVIVIYEGHGLQPGS